MDVQNLKTSKFYFLIISNSNIMSISYVHQALEKNLSVRKFLPCGTRERLRIVKLGFDKTEMDVYKVSYL